MNVKRIVIWVTLVVATLLGAGAFGIQRERHPRLVDVASTQCIDCHQDLFEGRDFVHEITEDCTSCHDVSISDAGTLVSLSEEEPELCISCHDDLETAVQAVLEAPHAPMADSCVICHDPHASSIQALLSSPVDELCAECHDIADLLSSHSGQLTSKTDCLQCHIPHGSANNHMLTGSLLHAPFADGDCNSCHRPPFAERVRLRARGERVCTACHGDVVQPVGEGGSMHAALTARRPYSGCVDCHDPHMSASAALLVQEGTELCGKCHEDVVKEALAETGHVAAEDCSSCHSSHKAEHRRLLLEPLPTLCHECHDPEDTDLSRSHLGADVGSLVCTSCHTPHGAGNPKLLARTMHAVVEDCETCHDGSADKLIQNGESTLCLDCHDDIGELADKAQVPHAAMELGSCTECHNPHASSEEYLVKAPAGGACVECHAEQAASQGEFSHGVIRLIGCRACHEPHGGDNPNLLRLTGNDLCLACHDAGSLRVEEGAEAYPLLDRFVVSVDLIRSMATLRLSADGERDHPVAGHRVVGTPTEEELEKIDTTFKGELTCLTCHDPHKGATQKLLVGNAANSMGSCLACHPK